MNCIFLVNYNSSTWSAWYIVAFCWTLNLHGMITSCQVRRNRLFTHSIVKFYLPHFTWFIDSLSTVYFQIFRRGWLEKDSTAQNLPIAKAVYSFLQDNVSSSFSFPGWNNGRIVCQQSQLKQLLSDTKAPSSEIITLNNSPLNLPEAKISRSSKNNDKYKDVDSKSSNRMGTELLTTTVWTLKEIQSWTSGFRVLKLITPPILIGRMRPIVPRISNTSSDFGKNFPNDSITAFRWWPSFLATLLALINLKSQFDFDPRKKMHAQGRGGQCFCSCRINNSLLEKKKLFIGIIVRPAA